MERYTPFAYVLPIHKELHSCSWPAPTWLDGLAVTVDDCLSGKVLSVYSHDNQASLHEWRFNCYGFVAHMLLQSHPNAYAAVVEFMCSNQDQIPISFDHIPCPFHYASFFRSLVEQKNAHWAAVEKMGDLRRGDFIVYLPCHYTPAEIQQISNKRTGMHIMVVEKVVRVEAYCVELMIVDCTRYRHCWEDSRIKGGVGRSPLAIRIQEGKTILQWGSREKTWEKELSFGRLL